MSLFRRMVGFQLANSGTVGSACFDESKARDFESLAGLVLTSNAFPGTSSRGIGARVS